MKSAFAIYRLRSDNCEFALNPKQASFAEAVARNP